MMEPTPLLLGGTWVAPARERRTFQAVSPTEGIAFGAEYPVSTLEDLLPMLSAGVAASAALKNATPESIASFLEAYAAGIEARAEALAELAARETGLPKSPRLLNVELPRTTGQLREAAKCARSMTWREPVIDSAANIRCCRGPVPGPVLIIGPNNFPLAFNAISGGDFAAAIGSGNSVIAKAHPNHPGTSKLLAEAALEALLLAGLPPATVQMFYEIAPEEGVKLIARSEVAAVAFTGSRKSGLAIKEAADRAGTPVFLEMSSVNPVFVLKGAIAERGAAIAQEMVGSQLLGAGQFCTNPGLVILTDGPGTRNFIEGMRDGLTEASPGVHLSDRGPTGLEASVSTLRRHGAEVVCGAARVEGDSFRYENTLLTVFGERFLAESEALQTEAFGSAALVVIAKDDDELLAVARRLEGNLTGCIYSATNGADDALYDHLAPILRDRVGRLLNDKAPTGVAVTAAMHHGGPFPATGHPGFTAVGLPASMERFTALWCFDNVRKHRLPAVLADENPTGSLPRLIDGEWTTRSL